MGFTDKELEFIDKHSELVEKGQDGLKELFEQMAYELGDSSRLRILLAYNCLGTGAFKVSTETQAVDKIITGALFNRTTCKARGEPLLPAMFKGRTKVVLFNIQKGRIVDQKSYTLVDKPSLDSESLKGNYNLCVLDKPEHLATVKSCFDGTLIYLASFSLKDENLYHHSSYFRAMSETNDENAAKTTILQKLRNILEKKLEGFSKVVGDLMAYVESKLVF